MAQDVRSNYKNTEFPDKLSVTWLKLSQIPRFGPAALQKLPPELRSSPQGLFKLSPQDLSNLGFDSVQQHAILNPCQRTIHKVMSWLESSPDHFMLHFDSPDYPRQLKHIHRAPWLLFGVGPKSALSDPQIAMVGSRNPTYAGKKAAYNFARGLVEAGWTVTSGLAMGVDTCAHRGALEGNGQTIAVLGTGVDILYPKRNRQLVESIKELGGLLLSEFLPGTGAQASHFPQRNRIISGLSLGTLIVEAALKSGSLITARYALEQNREVFAIPGLIDNPLSQGCHYLIKDGAKLVEQVNDITDEFAHLPNLQAAIIKKNLQKSEVQHLASDTLLDSVDTEVTPIDVISHRNNLPVSEVMAKLLQYELRGLVTAVPGGYIKLGGK